MCWVSFWVLQPQRAIITFTRVSILVTALVLYVVGARKARTTVGRPWKSDLEMAVIGTVSALVGYAIGQEFQPFPEQPQTTHWL